MTTACPFGMERMNDPLFHRLDSVFNKAAFVKRVRMDHHLNIHRIGNRQTSVNRRWCGAPIFMQFQRTGPADHLFFECCRQ